MNKKIIIAIISLLIIGGGIFFIYKNISIEKKKEDEYQDYTPQQEIWHRRLSENTNEKEQQLWNQEWNRQQREKCVVTTVRRQWRARTVIWRELTRRQ